MLIMDKTMTSVEAIAKQAKENHDLLQRQLEPLEAIHSFFEHSERMTRAPIPMVDRPCTIPRFNLPDIPAFDENSASDICKSSKPKRRIGFAEWPDESEGVEY